MEFRSLAAPLCALALTLGSNGAGAAISSPAAVSVGKATPIAYRSAFDGYRAFRDDEPMVSWQETNRALGALGGHTGHVRGSTGTGVMSQDPGASAIPHMSEKPPTASKPTEPMPKDHKGHANHGGASSAPKAR